MPSLPWAPLRYGLESAGECRFKTGTTATGFLLPLIWNRGLPGPTNVVISLHRQAE